jgi:hypothetical protein
MTEKSELVLGGLLVRYTETEAKRGRWVHRGTVERVMWRAVPTDPSQATTYHHRRRDALAQLAGVTP